MNTIYRPRHDELSPASTSPYDSSIASPEQKFEPVSNGKKVVNSTKAPIGLHLRKAVKRTTSVDMLCIVLPLCSLVLWSLSLKFVNLGQMTDLGLVSVLPPLFIIALVVLIISFCLALQQPQMRQPILLLHLVLLVFMLYGITTLVESAPRFSDVYKHAGYVEYIMRTVTFDPKIYIYSGWPVFFALSAFVTQIAGYHSALSFVGWAPVFFNLIYLGPLYIIFTSATTDKRLMWLGLWFFVLTKWVEQDQFAPQALNFFLYLVIIAILVKWFKVPSGVQLHIRRQRRQLLDRFPLPAQRLFEWLTAPDMLRTPTQPGQRIGLLVILIIIFALVVSSHPLTPFFIVASVSALVIFRRCTPFWLPILMSIMIAAWIIFMAQPFLAGYSNLVTGSIGHVDIASNLTDRLAQGDPEHKFIAAMRAIMSVFICGLALVGGIRRWRKGYRDLTYVLLAIVPLLLFVAQSYTGEMFIRVYLFSLPLMAFFAASLFYVRPTSATSRWMTAAVLGISIVLLGGFLFTRYGTERLEYKTNDEINGVRYLYSIAPPNALFLEVWDGIAWQFQDEEKYSSYSVIAVLPDAVATQNVDAVAQFIENANPAKTYLIFTRSQKAMADSEGLPPGMLDRFEAALLRSGKFQLLYSNPDAQVLKYLPSSRRQIEGHKPGR